MIKKTILPNGIRLISEYMPETFSTTMMAWIDVGSNVETPTISGISHFIEHMLFKGTKTRTSEEIVWPIECSGGSINAFTEKECTCYYARVINDQISIALDILLDIIFNSTYEEKNIELERQVILEEIKMYEDTPDDLVHDLLIKSFWKNHPLSLPITGITDSITNISTDDIIKFVDDYYVPENIIISIAGNFNEEKIIDQVNKLTGHIKKPAKVKENKIPTINPEISVTEKDIEQTHICLGMRGTSILNSDRYATAILDVCLGGGMASRLFQKIREKRGLVYSINTYEALFRPSGIFGVYAGTNPTNVNSVINLIMEEIEEIKIRGLSEEEFSKAKIQLKGSLLIGLESTKYRASKNGRSELYFGKLLSIEEMCKAVDKVTQDDINRLSSYIFDNNYIGMSLVGPKESVSKELSLACL